MKKLKFNVVLAVLAIIGATSAYANCPAMDSIYINGTNNYAAPDPFGSGKDWVDVNKVYGTLPVKSFWRAMGRLVEENSATQYPRRRPSGPDAAQTTAIVTNVSCAYEAQPNGNYNSPFGLVAPDRRQKYKVDLNPQSKWRREVHEMPPFQPSVGYICMATSIEDCPFTIAQ